MLKEERNIEAIDQRANIDQETITEIHLTEMFKIKVKVKREEKEENTTTEKKDKDLTTDQNNKINLKIVKKIQIHHWKENQN